MNDHVLHPGWKTSLQMGYTCPAPRNRGIDCWVHEAKAHYQDL